MGHPQGDFHSRALHLVARDADEMGLRDLVVEDDEDDWPRTVVVGGPV